MIECPLSFHTSSPLFLNNTYVCKKKNLMYVCIDANSIMGLGDLLVCNGLKHTNDSSSLYCNDIQNAFYI